MIVGLKHPDDAGVYKLNNTTALIQTLDFLTPVVDSPYDFGRIAAANSLSDVYSMGGKPITAMNIVCFPKDDLPEDVLKETLAGGLEKINESGAALAGGHSVDDKEFKYGLSVTGVVHPDHVITNRGLRVGDRLILTKPLGTGIVATAVKGELAHEDSVKELVETAASLNKNAAEIMLKYDPGACTDVTGFGLGGHALEMARGASMDIDVYTENLLFLSQAVEFAEMGIIPEGTYKTRHFCDSRITTGKLVKPVMIDLVFDPQTSGGLLFSVSEQHFSECLKELQDNGLKAQFAGVVMSEKKGGHLNIC